MSILKNQWARIIAAALLGAAAAWGVPPAVLEAVRAWLGL
jgi:hypothetical protein